MTSNKKNLKSNEVKEENAVKEDISLLLEQKSIRIDIDKVKIVQGIYRGYRFNHPRKSKQIIYKQTIILLNNIHRIYLLIKGKTKREYDDKVSIEPPQLAKFIIYLVIPRNNREAILGDLEEDFHDVYRKFGLAKAKIQYCVQVMISIWPFVGELVKKLIKSSVKIFIPVR